MQDPTPRCGLCGERPFAESELDKLLVDRVGGLKLEAKPPPGHGRGGGRVIGTMVLMGFGVGIGGAVGEGLGAMIGFLVGLTPYRKHFWQLLVVKEPKLTPIPDLQPPVGRTKLAGVAQSNTSTVSAPGTQKPVLAASIVVREVRVSDGRLVGVNQFIYRATAATSFWLITEGRRILITGACWVDARTPSLVPLDPYRVASRLGVPRRLLPKQLVVEEARVDTDRRITVIGTLREERVPGLAYRDDVIETMRGEPGSPTWIMLA